LVSPQPTEPCMWCTRRSQPPGGPRAPTPTASSCCWTPPGPPPDGSPSRRRRRRRRRTDGQAPQGTPEDPGGPPSLRCLLVAEARAEKAPRPQRFVRDGPIARPSTGKSRNPLFFPISVFSVFLNGLSHDLLEHPAADRGSRWPPPCTVDPNDPLLSRRRCAPAIGSPPFQSKPVWGPPVPTRSFLGDR